MITFVHNYDNRVYKKNDNVKQENIFKKCSKRLFSFPDLSILIDTIIIYRDL